METGPKPILLIGRLEALLFKFKNIENLKFIARSNQICSVINKSYFPELSKENKNLFQELYVVDSNENRRTLVVSYIKSLEIMLLDKKIAESLKLIEKAYARFLRVSLKEKNINIKDISDQISGESIKILSSLLSDYKHFSKGTLSEFYDILLSNIGMHSPLLKDVKFSKLAKGKAKDFYNGINYLDISLCVASIEPKSKAITVHKSKGNEFDEVCLVLEEEKDLDFLLSPNILNDEEHRVYYVGASRAKNNLYIYIPELSIDNKQAIEKLDLIDIIELS